MSTMADIAKHAGVALSTVSYALSGKRPISEAAKKRVYQAMKELGYQPNSLAQAMVTKRTRIIALLYPTWTLGAEFVTSIAETATNHKYSLLLWTSTSEDQEVMQMTHQGFIDGAILMEVTLDDARVEMLKAQNLPFTMIGHREENGDISFVDLDFDYALEESIKHLVALGHERIALINQSKTMFERKVGYVVRSKEAFYREIQKRHLHGIDCYSEANEQAGYEITMSLLEQDPSISAFILMTPWVSGGVIRAIVDKGLSIPDDVSLVAIFSPRLAEMTTPALTSIDFPYNEMGRMGARLLIQQLDGTEQDSSQPLQSLLRPPLTIRRSSGPRVKR